MTESEQRDLVADRFSRDELALLMAALSDRLAALGRTDRVSLDSFPDRGVPLLVLDLFDWCRRRALLPALLEEIRRARPGIFDVAAPVPRAPIPVPPAAPITPDPVPSAAAVLAPVEPPGPMYAFVTGTGLGQAGSLLIGSCVLLENPDRVRGQVRAMVEDALHDPFLRTNAAIAALKRRTFDYPTDDPEIRTRFIELMTVLSFEAYAYYAPALPATPSERQRVEGASTFATVFEPLLADRMTNDRSRALRDCRRSRPERPPGGVRRSRHEGGGATQSRGRARGRRRRGDAGRRRRAGDFDCRLRLGDPAAQARGRHGLEQRNFERLHPQKIRLIHEIGTAKFFNRRRPLR